MILTGVLTKCHGYLEYLDRTELRNTMYGIEEIAVLNLLFSCWVQGFQMEDSYEDYFAGEYFIWASYILENNSI